MSKPIPPCLNATIQLSSSRLDRLLSPALTRPRLQEPPPPPLTWLDIIEEEHLTGDLWDEIRARADSSSQRSKPRIDSDSSDEDALDSDASSDSSLSIETPSFPPTPNKPRLLEPVNRAVDPLVVHSQDHVRDDASLAGLYARQYWINSAPIELGALDSSNPLSLAGALAEKGGITAEGTRVVSEVDVIAEVLGALQGRRTADLFQIQPRGSVRVRVASFIFFTNKF